MGRRILNSGPDCVEIILIDEHKITNTVFIVFKSNIDKGGDISYIQTIACRSTPAQNIPDCKTRKLLNHSITRYSKTPWQDA